MAVTKFEGPLHKEIIVTRSREVYIDGALFKERPVYPGRLGPGSSSPRKILTNSVFSSRLEKIKNEQKAVNSAWNGIRFTFGAEELRVVVEVARGSPDVPFVISTKFKPHYR